MRSMVGTEEPVDPAVTRRPLPFSRVWMTAFVLAVIAIGWTAIVVEFDTLSERTHVQRLDAVVSNMERALRDEENFLLAKGVEDLSAVTAGRPATGAEEIDRIWSRVEVLTAQAKTIDRGDAAAFSDIVMRLRAATDELDVLVRQADGGAGASEG